MQPKHNQLHNQSHLTKGCHFPTFLKLDVNKHKFGQCNQIYWLWSTCFQFVIGLHFNNIFLLRLILHVSSDNDSGYVELVLKTPAMISKTSANSILIFNSFPVPKNLIGCWSERQAMPCNLKWLTSQFWTLLPLISPMTMTSSHALTNCVWVGLVVPQTWVCFVHFVAQCHFLPFWLQTSFTAHCEQLGQSLLSLPLVPQLLDFLSCPPCQSCLDFSVWFFCSS